MNRISGKPLKTRDSGTLGVAGIPCLLLGLCLESMRAADVNSHSGHKSDPSVAVLTPAAKGLTPVVTVLTPPLVQSDPSKLGAITLASNGVLVSGRYEHGKPRKPVNPSLSAVHSFEIYIISVCF